MTIIQLVNKHGNLICSTHSCTSYWSAYRPDTTVEPRQCSLDQDIHALARALLVMFSLQIAQVFTVNKRRRNIAQGTVLEVPPWMLDKQTHVTWLTMTTI